MPRRPFRPGELPGLMKRPRDGIWVYRRAVPPALRATLNRREVIVSLGTREEAEARAKAVEEAKKVEQLFHETRISLLEAVPRPSLLERSSSSSNVGTPEQDAIALRALEARPEDDLPPEQWSLTYLLNTWADDMMPLNLEEYRAAEMAVARFIVTMGNLPVGQITPAILRAFKKKLRETPHHRSGKGLDARAIEPTMRELRKLLRWYKDGIEGRLE